MFAFLNKLSLFGSPRRFSTVPPTPADPLEGMKGVVKSNLVNGAQTIEKTVEFNKNGILYRVSSIMNTMSRRNKIIIAGYGVFTLGSFLVDTYCDGASALTSARVNAKTPMTSEQEWIVTKNGCGHNVGTNTWNAFWWPVTIMSTATKTAVPKLVLYFNPPKK